MILEKDESMETVISGINDYLVMLNTPKNFDYSRPENIASSIRKSFSNSCSALEEMGVINPQKLTLYDFNAKIDYYEAKQKKKSP